MDLTAAALGKDIERVRANLTKATIDVSKAMGEIRDRNRDGKPPMMSTVQQLNTATFEVTQYAAELQSLMTAADYLRRDADEKD